MIKMAVIGAGLSGLSVAHLLKHQADVTVFEKARGVSGRMSTRRSEPYFFDHGAQYFTVRTEAFQNFIAPLVNQGLIQRWNARYAKFDATNIIEHKQWTDDEPRYVGVPSMNILAKHLANNLDIRLNTRVTALTRDGKWQLTADNGQLYKDFDWVICTAPSPQTTELLPASFQFYEDIKTTPMRACFSLMLGFAEKLALAFDAAHVINSDISWIAVNSSKPGRPEPFAVMAHSSANYAAEHIDDNREEVMRHLSEQVSTFIGHDANAADFKTVHGWRYANVTKRDHLPVLLDTYSNLGVCGDWCYGGRVEGAFTSANQLVNALKERVL